FNQRPFSRFSKLPLLHQPGACISGRCKRDCVHFLMARSGKAFFCRHHSGCIRLCLVSETQTKGQKGKRMCLCGGPSALLLAHKKVPFNNHGLCCPDVGVPALCSHFLP